MGLFDVAFALLVVAVVLFVGLAARTFYRSWQYREALKDEQFGAISCGRALVEGATGDLAFFTSAAHPFHNSWVNRTLFTHVGVIVRGRDLLDAGVTELDGVKVTDRDLYIAECAEGISLASFDPREPSLRLPGGSYLVPFTPRLHGYNGLVYLAARAEGHRLCERQRRALALAAAATCRQPYPGRWAMVFSAVVGIEVSKHKHCYQHAASVLNSVDESGPWPAGFFSSPARMDDAAMGRDPKYERARVVSRLDDTDRIIGISRLADPTRLDADLTHLGANLTHLDANLTHLDANLTRLDTDLTRLDADPPLAAKKVRFRD